MFFCSGSKHQTDLKYISYFECLQLKFKKIITTRTLFFTLKCISDKFKYKLISDNLI